MSKMSWLWSGVLALLVAGQLRAGDYTAMERGPGHTLWRSAEVTPSGETTFHQYVELADGLNYFSDGEWKASVPVFEVFKDKGFVARRGALTVILSANLEPGGVDILCSSGRLRGNIVGLGFFSAASGKNATLATMRSVPGELIAPNQVLYSDCFSGDCGVVGSDFA